MESSSEQANNTSKISGGQPRPSLIGSSISHTNRLTALTLCNSTTGKVINFPLNRVSRRAYQFKRACRALELISSERGLAVYFVTFTLNSESADSITREVSRVLTTIRNIFHRAGLPFYYCWVVELQKERYYRYGVKALHWHMAIAVPPGSLPDCQFIKKAPPAKHIKVRSQGSVITTDTLFKRWGKGLVFSTLAWSGVFGYLGKYLSKELESYLDYGEHFRRFGGSQLGVYAYPEWAREDINELERRGAELKGFRRIRSAGSVSYYRREVTAGTEYTRRGHKTVPIRPDKDGLTWYWRQVFTLRSPWRRIEANHGVP